MTKRTGKRIGGGPNGPSLTIPPAFAPASVVKDKDGHPRPTANKVLRIPSR